MQTGRLLAIAGSYNTVIQEYPIPKALDDGCVVQIEAALICGSDGHMIKMNPASPFCNGHEFAGRIIDIGKDASRSIRCMNGVLQNGDRIVVYPHITCGICPSCIANGSGVCGVCDNDFIYGGPSVFANELNTDPQQYPHFKGGFGEYVYLYPDTYVWKIPDDMPSEVAALLDPVAVAMRAVEMATTEWGSLNESLNLSSHVLVIGPGPIGILAGMILHEMGVEQLVITGHSDTKLKKALQLTHADLAMNLTGMTDKQRIAAVREITGGGAGVVLQCANRTSATIQGLQMVKKLGTFIEVGLPMSFLDPSEVTVNLAGLVFESNAKVMGLVANTPSTFDRAFRFLMRHKTIPFHELITHRFHTLEDYLPTIRKLSDEDYLKAAYLPVF